MTMGPTEEFVREHLALSQELLVDSIDLLERKRSRSSIDRAYYAVHHGAIALLAKRGIRLPKSHRGLVNVFGREIVNTGVIDKEFGRMLSDALEHRMSSTYNADAEITLEDNQSVVANTERFLAKVRSILNY